MPSTPLVALARCNTTADYEASLREAGARVEIVDHTTPLTPEALARWDGILLPGGDDVDPARYGETAHPATRVVDPARDAFEIELAVRALERDVPLLGICRGIQVLNVALGGSLFQDIPDQIGRTVEHADRSDKRALAHEVEIATGSRLAETVAVDGHGRCAVNSRHHQAVKRLAPGLVVTATSPDGIIEAVEHQDARFCVGVQWHPENFVGTGRFAGLFRALVEAARQGSAPT